MTSPGEGDVEACKFRLSALSCRHIQQGIRGTHSQTRKPITTHAKYAARPLRPSCQTYQGQPHERSLIQPTVSKQGNPAKNTKRFDLRVAMACYGYDYADNNVAQNSSSNDPNHQVLTTIQDHCIIKGLHPSAASRGLGSRFKTFRM